MKKKQNVKKLKLNREVIRELSKNDLGQIGGGADVPRSVLVEVFCTGRPPEPK
jgi:hypothetical protein